MKKSKPTELFNRMLSRVDFPPVAAGLASRIEIEGGREILIEGCDAVLEYDSDKIVLRLRDCIMAVSGSGLDLSRYGACNLTVSGRIGSLVLTEE